MKNSELSRRQFCKLSAGTAVAAALGGLGSGRALAASFEADELCYMSAEELVPLFRSRKLSPVEVLKAQIARYEAVGDRTNSVTYTHFDEAMEQAKAAEKRYINGTPRALEGLTIGVKANIAVKGMPFHAGLRIRRVRVGMRPRADQRFDRACGILARLTLGCLGKRRGFRQKDADKCPFAKGPTR